MRLRQSLYIVGLEGLMVSVIAIRPKLRRFKSASGYGFLRNIKNRSTPPFGGEVKPEASRSKI
jgi:hypothetical protein